MLPKIRESHYLAVSPPVYYFQFFQQRWKKQRRKKERVSLNDEQKATKLSRAPIRLEDHVGSPEPAYSISRNIKTALARVVSADRTKKDFGRRIRYKQLQAAGMTVDSSHRKYGSVLVTDLTKQQHEAVLPRSALHERFPFPHTLEYKCFWGPASVKKDTLGHCTASFNIDELGLQQHEKDIAVKVVPGSYDPIARIIKIEANSFDDLNQNAALLGDILQRFINDIRK